MDRCLITSCSNIFFPSLLNLLGSLQANYPNHPKIYVYNLGLHPLFLRELRTVNNLEILDMPAFCPFWRSCYTWKTYIFSHPLADLNLYLDAGNQVLRPLDEIFQQISNRGYFTVSQGDVLKTITPPDYKQLSGIGEQYDQEVYITAGIFGFQNTPPINTILQKSYEAALTGLCLGFSASEQSRNHGYDKSSFIRDCPTFRHDQTLLNIFLRQGLGRFYINDLPKYGGWQTPHDHPEQLIWNLRRNYRQLQYADQLFTAHPMIKKIALKLLIISLNGQKLARRLIKILWPAPSSQS
jgi:hypothetical protein